MYATLVVAGTASAAQASGSPAPFDHSDPHRPRTMPRMLAQLLRTLVATAGAPLAVADPPGLADAIIVLGAPLTPDGRLSSVLEERVAVGVECLRRGMAPLLCMSGGATGGGARCEADAMADRA